MRDKPLQRAQAAHYRSSLDEGLQEDSNARRTSAAPLFHRETGPARRKKIPSTASRSWTLTAQPVDNPGLLSKTENTDHADE
jgi:hypothetical protein